MSAQEARELRMIERALRETGRAMTAEQAISKPGESVTGG
jgi:hypothetical protein